MIRLYLILSLAFAFLFYRFPETFQRAAHLQLLQTGISGETVHLADGAIQPRKYNGFYIPAQLTENGKGRLMGPAGPLLETENDISISVPFFGDGYFQYKKAGKGLTFHDQKGEILWEREIRSYPYPEHRGRSILLLTGDGNRVDLLDRDGNTAGQGSVSGNILTDARFASVSGDACIVFATGGVYEMNVQGVSRGMIEEGSRKDASIVKSCSTGPNGDLLAIHFLKEGKDFFQILEFSTEGEETLYRERSVVALPSVYPHLLHSAINSSGLLVATPEATLLFSISGKKLLERSTSIHEIYRPVLSLKEEFFLFGEGNRLYLLSGEGYIHDVVDVPFREKREPWEIVSPGTEDQVFALRKGETVSFFRAGYF